MLYFITNVSKDYYYFLLLQIMVSEKTQNLRRLEAQRNELNSKGEYQHLVQVHTFSSSIPFISCAVRNLKEELQLLQEQGSHVGEVVKPMDKQKVLVKVCRPCRL